MRTILAQPKIWIMPLLFILFILSCQKDEPVVTEPAQTPLSPEVLAAKQWVESWQARQGYSDTNSSLTITRQSSSKQVQTMNITALWGNAWVGRDSVVEIPLVMPEKIAYSTETDASKMALDAVLTRLIVLGDDGRGEPFAVLMHITGNASYLQKHGYSLEGNRYKNMDADFSGTIIYTYLDGSFCYGWRFENGVPTQTITDGHAKEGIARSNVDCTWYIYTEWRQSCYNGECTNWFIFDQYTYVNCTYSTLKNPNDTEQETPPGNAGGGSGGGGGVPGNNENQNNPEEPTKPPTNPCEQAAALGSDLPFKQVMELLKDGTEQRETAYYYTNDDLNQDNELTVYTQQGNIGDPYIDLYLPANPIDVFAHYHYESLRSIFSGADIYALYQLLDNGKINNPGTFTFSLVTAKGTAYLLMIDNVETFRAYGKKTFGETTSALGAERTLEFILSICGVTNDGSIANNEIGFLNFLRTNDTGLSLFVGRYDSFNTWTKKAIDRKTGEVFTPLCP